MPITERKRLYDRQWYEAHKEEAKAKARANYQKNRLHNMEISRIYYQTHKAKEKARKREWRAKLKMEVLTHYGNDKYACVQCGFSDIRALSIDHINGGGIQHLRQAGIRTKFYYWLKKNNYPNGYQTLCMNCQKIKTIENKELGDRYVNYNQTNK